MCAVTALPQTLVRPNKHPTAYLLGPSMMPGELPSSELIRCPPAGPNRHANSFLDTKPAGRWARACSRKRCSTFSMPPAMRRTPSATVACPQAVPSRPTAAARAALRRSILRQPCTRPTQLTHMMDHPSAWAVAESLLARRLVRPPWLPLDSAQPHAYHLLFFPTSAPGPVKCMPAWRALLHVVEEEC